MKAMKGTLVVFALLASHCDGSCGSEREERFWRTGRDSGFTVAELAGKYVFEKDGWREILELGSDSKFVHGCLSADPKGARKELCGETGTWRLLHRTGSPDTLLFQGIGWRAGSPLAGGTPDWMTAANVGSPGAPLRIWVEVDRGLFLTRE